MSDRIKITLELADSNTTTVFIVDYSKIHSTGSLAGMITSSVVSFPTMAAAKAWAEDADRNPAIVIKGISEVNPADDEVRIPGISLLIKRRTPEATPRP
jgi:hypothetical protein